MSFSLCGTFMYIQSLFILRVDFNKKNPLILTDKRTDVWSRPQIFSPKKLVFPPLEILSKIVLTFVYLYSMQLFTADPKIFSKKKKINFLSVKI